MPDSLKPRVFIASSKEALLIARALQHELRDIAISQLWNQGFFRPGTVVLDDLVKGVDGFDFGVFVFAPDDVLKMRNKDYSAVRDDVVFELGIFVGKLGPKRSIFVVPEQDSDLRLPTDLTGVIPAKYTNDYIAQRIALEVAVSGAIFQISEVIRSLGPLQGGTKVLFDSKDRASTKILDPKQGYIYKDDKRVGGRAEGSLDIGADGLLTINRSNTDGKFEIHMRPQGPRYPSFERVAEPRRLQVNCKAKAEGGACKVRFVAKDEARDKWLADHERIIEPGEWIPLEFYLWVDPTRDFLLRIDQEVARGTLSKLLIQDLLITDENV
jgi:hypothetical protein